MVRNSWRNRRPAGFERARPALLDRSRSDGLTCWRRSQAVGEKGVALKAEVWEENLVMSHPFWKPGKPARPHL